MGALPWLRAFLAGQRRNLLARLRAMLRDERARRKLFFWILLLSVAFTAVLFYRNIGALRAQDLQFRYHYLLLAVPAFALGFIPSTVVWHHLLRLIDVRLPYRVNLEYYLLSSMPRHIPGLFVYFTSRSLLYENQQVDAKKIVLASALEISLFSLTGFLLALLIFLVASLFQDHGRTAQTLLLLFVAVLAVTAILLRLVARRVFQDGALSWRALAARRGGLALTALWALVSWLGGGVFLYCVINAVTPLGWDALPLVIAVWSASGAMSMSLDAFTNGFGVRVLSLGALLATVVAPVTALVVAVGINLVFIAAEVVWIALLLGALRLFARRAGRQ